MRRLLDYLLARGWRPVEGRNAGLKRVLNRDGEYQNRVARMREKQEAQRGA